MKIFLLFTLLLTVFTSCNEKMEPSITFEPEVRSYIDSFGIYIRLTDRHKASKILEKEYDKVVAYMDDNNLNKENYFLLDGEFALSKDLNYIMIPIRHYESLKIEMKKARDMKPLIQKQIISKSGNLSGKDGYLILKLKSNKIDRFQLWE